MRTLTVRQPWAGLIALGVKDVENRTWHPPNDLIGGRFAVHAGRMDDPERIAAYDDIDTSPAACGVRGFVICTVRLVTVTRDATSRWAIPGAWHWVLDDPRQVRNSPKLRGQRGLWTP